MAFDAEVPTRRRAPVSAAVLNAARRALIKALAENDVAILCPSIVAEAVAREVIAAQRAEKERRVANKIGADTRSLAAMQVGEEIVLRVQSMQSVRSKMKVARSLIGGDPPAAAWTARTLEDGRVKVTRLEDGADARVERYVHLSPITIELAAMDPGESKLSASIKTMRGSGALHGCFKVKARKLLREPAADWTVKRTSLGSRVWRLR